MLLVIHNLPSNTRYADVKALIKEQCGLTELIVDNLVSEGNSKKVTVGVADETDGSVLMRKLNGFFVGGQQIFIENAKQKKADQNFINHYDQGQYNQYPPSLLENTMYFQPQNENPQFFPPMVPMDSSQLPQLPPPNFGVPYYMTNQNPNVGNTAQYSEQVQYPQLQGSTSSDSYRPNFGMNRGHETRDRIATRSRSRSPNRGPQRERESRGPSRWNESERKGSDNLVRGSDKTSMRDRDRYNDDQSYRDRSYQDSYQDRSNRDYGSNKHTSDRFEKNSNPSEAVWESPNRHGNSSFSRRNESSDSNDRRKVDSHSRRFNPDREPQDFRNDQYSQSRNQDNFSRRDNNGKNKRVYDAPDKNNFAPKNKKFGNNQQYNSKSYSDRTYNPPQNKINYFNKMGNQGPAQPMQSKPNKFKIPTKKGSAPGQNPLNASKGMAVRWEGWLCQASSVIAQQILKNAESGFSNKKHPVVVKLKACVRSRIDVITGDEMSMKLNDMLTKYREKFPVTEDRLFYETIVNKVDQTEVEEFYKEQKARLVAKNAAMEINNESKADQTLAKQVNSKPVQAVAKQVNPKTGAKLKPNQKQNKQMPPLQMPATKKLPKKPDAKVRQAQKEELFNISVYTLDDLREKILKEELDKIFDVCNEQIQSQEEEGEAEKSIGKFMSDVVMTNLRNIMSLMVKKRILDVRTNLAVRVYCHPKRPNRIAFETFLKKYGVISLKKSDMKNKLYVATCDTYENYDALCGLTSTRLESSTLQFRPFQRIKSPAKNNKNKHANLDMDGNCEEGGEEIDEEGGEEVNEEGDEGMLDDAEKPDEEVNANEEKKADDVIEIPENAVGDEEQNGYNKYGEHTNENSEDVIEVVDVHNESADTIVIEDDNGEPNVAVNEVTTSEDLTKDDNEAAPQNACDSQNIEPENEAIDFAEDDLEDF